MTQFRNPKKQVKKQSSVDGFILPDNHSVDKTGFQSRFRTNYSPPRSQSDTKAFRPVSDDMFVRKRSASLDDRKFRSENQSDFIQQETDKQFNIGRSHNKTNNNEITKKHRFGRRKPKNRLKAGKVKRTVRAVSVVAVALVIGVSSLFAYGFIKSRNIFKGDGEGAAALQQNVDPSRLNGEGDGRVNILLLGKGGPGQDGPDLTDTMLLASIDPIQNEAALVSVPRDMYVQDQNGNSTKINAIYANAKQARLANSNRSDSDRQAAEDIGLRAAKEAVTDVLGIPVHYYVMVDFVAFEEAINTVGGITVDVKEPLFDRTIAWKLGGNPLIADRGLQTFDGKRALLYARSRMGSARGDFDRTERQREIVVGLQKKVLSIGTFSNPFTVVELLNNFGDRVRTDLNGLGEIKRLYEIGQHISSDNIVSVGLADPPNILVTTGMIGGQSVVLPTAGLYQYDEIRSYIRNTIRDPFLKQEDARIVILNGTTTAGLATATSEELKSYGYNVVSVDNAPTSNYVQNRLFDLTNGQKRYTKSYIEKRLGLVSEGNPPAGLPTIEDADFVIILGTDEVIKATN